MNLRSIASAAGLLISLAVFAPGCGADDAQGEAQDLTQSISFTPLEVSKSAAKAGLTVLKSKAAYEEFFGSAAPSSVDFQKHWVVHYSMGMRKTGGYGTEITHIEKKGSSSKKTLTVRTADHAPGEGCFVTQAITNPQVAVRINKQSNVKSTKVDADEVAVSCKLDAYEVNSCVRAARECAFAKLAGGLTASKARGLLDECMATVATDDPDLADISCGQACDAGEGLCDEIATVIASYSKEPAACVKTLESCVDSCYAEGDNQNDGIAPDEIEQTSEHRCLVKGLTSDCNEFAQHHTTCGGTLKSGTHEECLAECDATAGAWLDDPDSLKEYCAGQCE